MRELWLLTSLFALATRTIRVMWRVAQPADDDLIVEMCLRLYAEDAGLTPVRAENMRGTLEALRREPRRGQAVALEIEGRILGYALLIPYWSNEFGGDVCAIDELFIVPEGRSRGHGRSLFDAIARGELWPTPIVAMALGVTPGNSRARKLYERLGFAEIGVSMVRRLP